MAVDHFDGERAAHYDEWLAEMFEPGVVGPAVDFLAGLAPGGRALEMGIGTGRIALPLRQRGVEVHGIDLSAAMVRQLGRKPGGSEIDVTVGDFSMTPVPGAGSFQLVYLVFNTIENLTDQDAQVACFANAAAHLEPGGSFVVEDSLPQIQRLPAGDTVRPFTVTETHLGFDEYDVASQTLVSHHYWFSRERAEVVRMPFRYVWPAELDLMARLAGLALRERWGGWQREPFDSSSTKHISVWTKAGIRSS